MMLYSKIAMVTYLVLCFTLSSVRGHATPSGWGRPKWPRRALAWRSVCPVSAGLRRERESGEAEQPIQGHPAKVVAIPLLWEDVGLETLGTKANGAPDTGTYPDTITSDLSDSWVGLVASLGLSHIFSPNQTWGGGGGGGDTQPLFILSDTTAKDISGGGKTDREGQNRSVTPRQPS